jgi:GxxExxY protein
VLSYPESEQVTSTVIGAAIEVHKHLGPGLLERVYDDAMNIEMTDLGLVVERQRSIPVIYKSRVLRGVYRPDLIVNGLVIVEVKAIEKTLPVHRCQVQTYLKLTTLHVGLLFNFNVEIMKHGVTRISL